jgi:hypothetical protein
MQWRASMSRISDRARLTCSISSELNAPSLSRNRSWLSARSWKQSTADFLVNP